MLVVSGLHQRSSGMPWIKECGAFERGGRSIKLEMCHNDIAPLLRLCGPQPALGTHTALNDDRFNGRPTDFDGSVDGTSQEEATRLKTGTIKHCALTVLKDAGPVGMPIDDIMAAIEDAGLRAWDANSKRVVQFVSFYPLIKDSAGAQCVAAASSGHPSRSQPVAETQPPHSVVKLTHRTQFLEATLQPTEAEKQTRMCRVPIYQALSSDEAFVRTSKGVYALSCLAGPSVPPTATRRPRAPRKVSAMGPDACRGRSTHAVQTTMTACWPTTWAARLLTRQAA